MLDFIDKDIKVTITKMLEELKEGVSVGECAQGGAH